MNQPVQTKWIALSERIYSALLSLYPVDYRHEYGPLMVQIFRDVAHDRYQQQGMAGVMFWWCATLLDLTFTVIEQHRKVKFTMSKSTFVQITGLLLVLGGAFSAVAAFSQFQPGDHSAYAGIYQVLALLFVPGFLLIGLGCIGLGMRYDQSLGMVGSWSLYLSGLGALIMAAGMVATSIEDSLWNIYLGGGILHVAALITFGLLHVWKPSLPIFRALPLQLAGGILIVLWGVLRTDSAILNNTLSFLLFLGMGLAWLAIGLAVNRQQREAVLAVA
ncbi:MAG: hypothetical protein K8I60_07910 [Anaerolineae bacterium]|nr:hypothetical protein [Anaerolineae bacterium]